MDLFENDVVGGKVTSTRMRTGQWSTNSQIIQVCGSWFCRTNGKRPKWTTPTVNTVSDRRVNCHKRGKPQTLLKRCPKAGFGLERGKMWVESSLSRPPASHGEQPLAKPYPVYK